MNNPYLQEIEASLESNAKAFDSQHFDVLKDAMIYSLSAGGKRLRPYLLLASYRLFRDDYYKALPAACAIEYVHTYSLIHDDLPCMDDDDLRRGKPSSHIQFGEDIALLAGDALLTLAFESMCRCDAEPANVVKAISKLSRLCGAPGMVGGQVIDLTSENQQPDAKKLLKMHELKTSALIEAACECGGILAGAGGEQLHKLHEFAYNLGLAFQIQDDVLDVTGDVDSLGKPIGSDAENQKNTYVAIYGLEQSKAAIQTYSDKAKMALSSFGDHANDLIDLVDALIDRKK